MDLREIRFSSAILFSRNLSPSESSSPPNRPLCTRWGDLRSAPGANRSGPVRHSCPSFQAGRRAALNPLPASEFNAAEGGLRPHGGNYHLTSTVHKGGRRTVLNLRAVRLLSSAYTILCAVTMKEAIFKNSRVYCKFSQHVSDQEYF